MTPVMRNAPTLDTAKESDLRFALLMILDVVDYTAGNCRPNEQVGAVLPASVIAMARKVLSR